MSLDLMHPFKPVELDAIRAKVQTLHEGTEWYSDPSKRGHLPFLFPSPRLPTDRFAFTGGSIIPDFEYIGREEFKTVWDHVKEIQDRFSANRIYIHGTMGYGKSHILAALACYLARTGKPVVYLPDCREMLRNPLSYIQCALLCALGIYSPSDLSLRTKIRGCSSLAEIVQLFETRIYKSPWFFVIDQMNAFDKEDCNEDEIANDTKDKLLRQLMAITSEHYLITSASANRKTVKHMEQKQTGDIKLSLMGGMSTVTQIVALLSSSLTWLYQNEMKHWWSHYKERVPKFESCVERERVEYLTGRIPLLLRPLLKFNGKDFSDVEDSFLEQPEIMAIEKNIVAYSQAVKLKSNEAEYAL
jgi:hypothetical protein